MKTIVVATCTALTVAAAASFVVLNSPSPQDAVSSASDSTQPQASAPEPDARDSQDQWQAIRTNALTRRLLALEKRLDHLASKPSAPPTKTSSPSPSADEEPPSTDPRKIGEQTLAEWMQETLRVSEWNSEATAEATSQAELTLQNNPEVELSSMECGDRFCKALLAGVDGAPPSASGLFGEPPFLGEGFTVQDEDGRLALYFTGGRSDLNRLREEASSDLN